MSVINFESFKAKKVEHERALQVAKQYNQDINVVLEAMREVAATEVTTTRIITEQEALEALGDNYITAEQLIKYNLMEEQVTTTLEDTVADRLENEDYDILDIGLEEYAKRKGINIIPFNPDIPY